MDGKKQVKALCPILFVVLLWSCGTNSTGELPGPAGADKIPAEQQASSAVSLNERFQMAALLYRWTEADSMDLLVNDYVYLYEALTAKPVDSIRIFDWMDKNRAKMRGYNGYFLLSEVGLYFFNKILFQTGDIARADSVLRLTIPVVNRLAEPLTGKKIVYRCAQEHPLPASGVYYFFDDFTVNTYSAFFMMDRSCGTWTLNKGILTLDWGGKQIQYTETDSVFVCKEKGRNLLKLSLN